MKGHSSAVGTTTTQPQGLGADNTALLKSILLFLVFLFIYDCTMLQVEFPI